ncbi:MAG: DUF6602 domain-containing protein [Pyrinomonadaceae bacterium]
MLSSSSKGYERETFVSLFLSELLPPIYRFGTGDITDSLMKGDKSRRSGQIDIVIEMPWAPSFPMLIGAGPRLYPAEAVGTAIEVKSNIKNQWSEVIDTATKLEPLRQRLDGISVSGDTLIIENETEESIPFFAVGYDGWSKPATLEKKAHGAPVDGVFVLKHKIFAWSDRRPYLQRLNRAQDELGKKQSGVRCDETQATCAKVASLIQDGISSEEIITMLNTERWTSTSLHFGDQQFLPVVSAGGWTKKSFEQLRKAFLQKTQVSENNEAILRFIDVVHREVGKRGAMSFDLSKYAK